MDMRDTIEHTLREALNPLHLQVTDETHMHNVPEDAQSHFKVTLVSVAFDGESLIQRHRRVNKLLQSQFDTGLHALALHTLTPEEWFDKGGRAPDTPECLGGAGQGPS